MSVSNDRAQSFASEVKINDDKVPGPHGMHSLAVAKDGRVYVSWLDERPPPARAIEGEAARLADLLGRDLHLVVTRQRMPVSQGTSTSA